mgnify:CR=1 FL=1
MYENKDFDDIFKQININPGDKILVSSSILKLLIQSRKENKKFDGNIIIDSLISTIGENGTLMFPAYNWDFCKGKDFDYNKTPSSAGSLSNLALKRKDFQRTKNPIYSFAVTGKNKDYICNLNHESCFGLDSPFGYLIENHGKNLFIDIDYKEGFTFDHVAEETVGVDYRYFKHFSGFYTDKLNRQTRVNYKMYVRNLSLNISMTAIDKKFDEILIKNNAYTKKIENGISFILIDINRAYKAAIHDLESKGGLIYPKKIET